jgi:hypothetical protein
MTRAHLGKELAQQAVEAAFSFEAVCIAQAIDVAGEGLQ